jgi:hypothetical protein
MPEFVTNIAPNGRRPTVDRRHEGDRVDAVLEESLGLPTGAIARQMNGKRADPTLYKLATQAQAIVNRTGRVPLSAEDLMPLGADRLLAIVTNGGTKTGSAAENWAGYSLNSFHAAHSAYNENEDAGEMLRLATTVRTLFGGSSPETIAKLGRERLEALKADLTPEKAAQATNGARDFHALHSAYDEFAGYDINNPMGTK